VGLGSEGLRSSLINLDKARRYLRVVYGPRFVFTGFGEVYGRVRIAKRAVKCPLKTLGTAVVIRGRSPSWGGTYVVGFRGPLQKSHNQGPHQGICVFN